jgi:transposase
MKAYSLDLRQRIISAVEIGEFTQGEIAERFSVTTRFIFKLIEQKREMGHIEPLPHGGGRRPLFDAQDRERLRAEVERKPDATLKELQEQVHPGNRKRDYASTSTISRTLIALELRRKKKDSSALRGR